MGKKEAIFSQLENKLSVDPIFHKIILTYILFTGTNYHRLCEPEYGRDTVVSGSLEGSSEEDSIGRLFFGILLQLLYEFQILDLVQEC